MPRIDDQGGIPPSRVEEPEKTVPLYFLPFPLTLIIFVPLLPPSAEKQLPIKKFQDSLSVVPTHGP